MPDYVWDEDGTVEVHLDTSDVAAGGINIFPAQSDGTTIDLLTPTGTWHIKDSLVEEDGERKLGSDV